MTNYVTPQYKTYLHSFSKITRELSTAGVLAAALLAPTAAKASLMFDFTFSSDPGVAAATAAQQQAIVTGGQLFSTLFGKYFTNSATLQYDVVSQSSGVASASSASELTGVNYLTDVVQTKVQGGGDMNDAVADGAININWSNNLVLDPNAPVDFGAGQLDLFSILDHELTHSLGFASVTGLSDGTLRGKFDNFLTTLGGTSLINPDGTINEAAYADAALNNALFIGSNAVAASGGKGVSIQGQDSRPDLFSGALSHLGTIAFSAPVGGSPSDNALMLCCGGLNVTGQGRDYNAAEVGILTDLGYTRVAAMTAVPEPSSMLLLLSGVGVALGFVRRKTGSANPTR